MEQISLDCCRTWAFPTKGRQLFRNGGKDPSCSPLLPGGKAERALQHIYIHIWTAQALCHPFETYFRAVHDGTQVLLVPFAPQFAKQPRAGAGRVTAGGRGLWPPFLCLVSVGLVRRLLWVTFGPHRKIRIKTERNFLSHQVLFPAVEGNHIIWCLSNTYLVPSWNHLGFLPSLLLLRSCLSSRGYKPSSNFQPKYVQGSLCCV